jgi:DNA helicase II / ATP-dependent DNA helicase PcrA
MAWNDDLTGVHLTIAGHVGPFLRVVAGPGTGKTFALMRRVARLIENGVGPGNILAVTFTRTSARDLVDQLQRLRIPGAEQVVARTLHSLSFSILHHSAVFEVTARHPRVLLGHERDMLVCDLKAAFGGKRKVEELTKAFEAYWAKLQHEQPGFPSDPVEQRFDRALRDWLRFHGAMLVGELIPLAYRFIVDNPLSPSIPRYSRILVDEYQDLNRADQGLIDALALPTSEVTVVGDEDQSIYGFRYAHPEGITQYDRTHANTHDEVLEECRRCPARVVEMAASLIQENPRARASVLRARAGNPLGDVTIVQHASLKDEAQSIAKFVEHYLDSHLEIEPGQVLILATRRIIGYAIRDAVNARAAEGARRWTSQSFFAEECLETLAAREGFTVLALHVDPNDRAALRAWLGLGDISNNGRAAAYARIRTHAEANALSPREVLDSLMAGTLRIPHTAAIIARYFELGSRLRAVQDLQGQALVDVLFPATADCDEIREIAANAVATSENIEELLDRIRSLVTQPELPDDHSQVVRVMSLHKSKGLTARAVVIAGCVAGALPSLDPSVPANQQTTREQEQRRLFYVALTRTTETLVISSPVRMSVAEAAGMGLPMNLRQRQHVVFHASPFVGELGGSRPPTETTAEWRTRVGF